MDSGKRRHERFLREETVLFLTNISESQLNCAKGVVYVYRADIFLLFVGKFGNWWFHLMQCAFWFYYSEIASSIPWLVGGRSGWVLWVCPRIILRLLSNNSWSQGFLTVEKAALCHLFHGTLSHLSRLNRCAPPPDQPNPRAPISMSVL